MHVDQNKVAAAFQLLAEAFSAPEEKTDPVIDTEPVPATVARHNVAPVETAPPKPDNVAPIGGPGAMFSAPPAQQSLPPTDLRPALQGGLQALVERYGNNAAPDLLARYGCTKFSEVPEARMPDMLQDIKEALGNV